MRRRSTAPLTLPLASAAAGVATLGILTRLASVARSITPATPVDRLVEVGVTAAGAGIGLWLTGSLLLATACAIARLLGRTWRGGERAVARCAPRAVRRALVSVAVASVGLGMSGVAQAETLDPVSVDLGWVATAPAEPSGARPTEPAVPRVPALISASPTDVDHPVPAPTLAPPTGTPAAPVTDRPATTDDDHAASPTALSPAVPPAGASTVTAPATSPAIAVPAAHPTAASPLPGATPTDPTRAPSTSPSPSPGAPSTPAPTPVAPPAVHTVQAGESLWSIASDYLPDGASASDIAVAWPEWYSANREVVGLDPGHIEAGQVLHAPSSATTTGDKS